MSEGTADVIVSAKLDEKDSNYTNPEWLCVTVTVVPGKHGGNDIGNATVVVLSGTEFTYNGKVQKPSVKVTNGEKLTEGKDYEVVWSDASSKNAGTYTVTVKGKGIYKGTAEETYRINKAPNSLKLKAKKAKVKRKALKNKSVVVKRTKALKIKKKNGKVTYSLKSASKKGSDKKYKKYFKVNKKNGNITVKKGLKKGTYRVTVNVKAAGDANHNSKTKKATVTVRVR